MPMETKEVDLSPPSSSHALVVQGDIALPQAQIAAQGDVIIGHTTTHHTTNVNVAAATQEQAHAVLKAEQQVKQEAKEEAVNQEEQALAKALLNTLPQPLQDSIPRLDFLTQLEMGFQTQAQKGVAPIQVIHGMGGVGKTQLATNYANQQISNKDFVVWIYADPLQLENQWLTLGEKLLGGDLKGMPKPEQLAHIRAALSQRTRWLMVLDNVEQEAALTGLLPTRLLPTQQVLITTRSVHWAHYPVVELTPFTPVECQTYVESRLALDQCVGAEALIQALGYLPLAMAHAVAYMKQTSTTAQAYLKRYQDKGIALLNRADIKQEGNYNATVLTTYQLSLIALTAQNPTAASLLNGCAYLHPDGIKKSILKGLLPDGDRETLDDCIRAMRQYSFLSKGKTGFVMHRLVQQAICHGLSVEAQQTHISSIADCLTTLYEEEGKRTPTQQDQHQRALMPHLELLLTQEPLLSKEQLTSVLDQLGRCYLYVLGEPAKGRDYWERALTIKERHYGPDHTQVAITLANLGNAYGDLGDVAQQRDLLTRALTIKERHFGPDHTEVAITLTNLGNAYGDLGDVAKKRDLLTRALTIDERHFGPDHYQVAITLTNLGNAYGELGDVAQKRDLLTRALTIKERHYGPDHTEVAITLTNLGNAYGDLGDVAKKRDLLTRALTIQERHYGPDHYQMAITLGNLGNAYGELGDSVKNRDLLTRALTIDERHFGPDHYQVASTLVNLGNAYGDLGDVAQKRDLLTRALTIQERHYGPDHYQVASTLVNLGNAYGDLGNVAQKRDLLTRALTIEERHYGPDHTEVAITLGNLGNAYGDLGDVAQQRDLLTRALTIQERHFGPEHPALGITLTNLAVAHCELQQPQLALERAQRAYRVLMNHPNYGAAHPTTKQCLNYLQSAGQFSLNDLQGVQPAALPASSRSSAALYTAQRRNSDPAADEKAAQGNQKNEANETVPIAPKKQDTCTVC